MPEDEKTVNSLSLFSLCATITDAANAASGMLLVNNVGIDKNKSPDTKLAGCPCCTISSKNLKVVWRSIKPKNTSVKKAKDRKQSFIMYRSIRSMMRNAKLSQRSVSYRMNRNKCKVSLRIVN